MVLIRYILSRTLVKLEFTTTEKCVNVCINDCYLQTGQKNHRMLYSLKCVNFSFFLFFFFLSFGSRVTPITFLAANEVLYCNLRQIGFSMN